MSDQGYSLLPSDEVPLSPDEAVEAAVASALAPDATASTFEPEPIGSSWLMDPLTGLIVTRGGSAVLATGLDALTSWIIVALRSAQLGQAIFDDNFGMRDPDSGIGEADPRAALADYEERLRGALTRHDRIVDVTKLVTTVDQGAGVIYHAFDIVTDEEEVLSLSSLRTPIQG